MGVSIVRAFSTGTIVATELIKVTDFSPRISAGIPRRVTNKVPLINALSIWLFFPTERLQVMLQNYMPVSYHEYVNEYVTLKV